MGPLPAGNANGDAIIDVSDFGLLAAAFNTQFGDGAYNANADFDSNGFVNSFDYDLLVSNFGKFSPYEAGQ